MFNNKFNNNPTGTKYGTVNNGITGKSTFANQQTKQPRVTPVTSQNQGYDTYKSPRNGTFGTTPSGQTNKNSNPTTVSRDGTVNNPLGGLKALPSQPNYNTDTRFNNNMGVNSTLGNNMDTFWENLPNQPASSPIQWKPGMPMGIPEEQIWEMYRNAGKESNTFDQTPKVVPPGHNPNPPVGYSAKEILNFYAMPNNISWEDYQKAPTEKTNPVNQYSSSVGLSNGSRLSNTSTQEQQASPQNTAPKEDTSGFLAEYKKLYGADYSGGALVKKDGMDSVDFGYLNYLKKDYDNINAENDRYNNDMGALDEDYTSQTERNEAERIRMQQQMDVTRELLRKYLPVQLKAQGLNGLGISENAELQVYNNHKVNSAVTQEALDETRRKLREWYGDGKQEISNTLNNNLQNITNASYGDQWTKENDARIERETAETQTMYADIVNSRLTGLWDGSGTVEEVEEYYNTIKDKLSKSDQLTIEAEIDRTKRSYSYGVIQYNKKKEQEDMENEKIRAENEKKSKILYQNDVTFNDNGGWHSVFGLRDFSSGDNFSLKDKDGKKYYIQSGGKEESPEIKNIAYGVKDDTAFCYNNQIYFKRNDIVYSVFGRDGKTTAKNTTTKNYTQLYNLLTQKK